MLIPTYYLLLKNWDIFATRCCILLIFNPNYFRGGEVKYIDKNILKIRIACDSDELHAISILWVHTSHLQPLSHFATVALFFVKYLPVTTIATTHITDMWHFCNMALDGSYSFITHFC